MGRPAPGLLLAGGVTLVAMLTARSTPGQTVLPAPASEHSASQEPPVLTADPLSDGRALWNLWGLSDERWRQVADGGELNREDYELLGRLLEGCGRLESSDCRRLAESEAQATLWQREPSRARGRLFPLSGRVVGLQPVVWPAGLQERLAEIVAWRIELVDKDRGTPLLVFAREVPRAWQGRTNLDEPAGLLGFFVKQSPPASPDPSLPPGAVFVARRVAWYPATDLGALGMDVGLFDTVQHRTRLTAAEREPFFELLAAVGRSAQGALLQAAGPQSHSVVPLFNRPSEQQGRLVGLSGVARRAVAIDIPQESMARRAGLTRYYEIELFTDDSQGSPLVCCVRTLPPGMPVGEGLHERVRMAGFFFKVWAYEVPVPPGERTAANAAETRLQLAPLIIARDLAWQPRTRAVPRIGWPVLVLGALLLSGLAWWAQAGWRRPADPVRAPDAERPDFSGLRTTEPDAQPDPF